MSESIIYKHYLDKLGVNYIAGGRGDAANIPEKSKKHNRLAYISSGSVLILSQNDKIQINEQRLVLLQSDAQQYIAPMPEMKSELYWIDFTLDCGSANLFELAIFPISAKAEDPERITALFEDALKPEGPVLSKLLKQQSSLLKLITAYVSAVEEPIQYENYDARITSVIDYIENNLDKEIKIEDLAYMTHLHPNYFIRFFKSQTRMSPIAFITNMRLNKSCRLLKHTDMPVGQIASSVGIPDYSYFSRQFKKITGYTPSEYRELMHNRTSL